MGRVEGKVALITGAARGQGRSHALRLAAEGADIIAVDICSQIASVAVSMGTETELAQTVKEVEGLGKRILARQVDVRDLSALCAVVSEGISEFEHIDIVSANAGVVSFGSLWELSEQQWQDVIDVDLTGVWHTIKAAVPPMIAAGRGGSIVITSSAAGLKGAENVGHYVAAKHGLIGLAQTLANEVARHRIRVNTLCPGSIDTPFVHNEATYRLFRPDLEAVPTFEEVRTVFDTLSLLPLPNGMLEAADVSNALLWLASDEARYVTGVVLPVDAGWTAKSL
jgi:(+)-trans-carveol dehydrogenase